MAAATQQPGQMKEGGKPRFAAFSFMWTVVFAAATIGIAYFSIIAILGTTVLTAKEKDLVLAAIPNDIAAYIRIDFAELSLEERQILDTTFPKLSALASGKATVVALHNGDSLSWAIFLRDTDGIPPFPGPLRAWDEKLGIYVSADAATVQRMRIAAFSGRNLANDPVISASLGNVAELSPISGFVDLSAFPDTLPNVGNWLPDGTKIGFAVRRNSSRTLGFAAMLSTLARHNGFLGLALSQPVATQPMTIVGTTLKTVEIAGVDASPELLATLFHQVETKKSRLGSSLDGAEAAEMALTPFLDKSFHYATFSVGTSPISVAHFNGISPETALRAIKRYLSLAIPVRVAKKLPDGQTLDELVIADWPAFDGESDPAKKTFRYEDGDVSLLLREEANGITIVSPATEFADALIVRQGTRPHLSPVCAPWYGDSAIVLNLSTGLNRIYAQLNFITTQQPKGLNLLFTSVDNTVIFCE